MALFEIAHTLTGKAEDYVPLAHIGTILDKSAVIPTWDYMSEQYNWKYKTKKRLEIVKMCIVGYYNPPELPKFSRETLERCLLAGKLK